MNRLPGYCTSGIDIWMTISPLICFHIVEWHRPDRVLRQFGMRQRIPKACDTEAILHRYDLRGRQEDNWMDRHQEYIRRWNYRCDHIANAEAFSEVLAYNDPYMVWYRSITRLFVTPHGSFHHILVIKILQQILLFITPYYTI